MAIETLHLISLYAISAAHFEFSIHEENMSLNVMNQGHKGLSFGQI